MPNTDVKLLRDELAKLERQSPAGNWDIDFGVVLPGGSFSARPDVTVNLVTRDDDSRCGPNDMVLFLVGRSSMT